MELYPTSRIYISKLKLLRIPAVPIFVLLVALPIWLGGLPFNFLLMLGQMGGVAVLLSTLAIFCWIAPFRIRISHAALEVREFPWRQISFDLSRATKVTEQFNPYTGNCSQLMVEFGNCESAAYIDVSVYEPFQIQLLKRRIEEFTNGRELLNAPSSSPHARSVN